MGFRSNFIAEDVIIEYPQWFKDKYNHWSFNGGFAQTFESKFYEAFSDDERFIDIQKVIREVSSENYSPTLVVVLLHECGGITRVEISKYGINASEPSAWRKVEQVEHDYCYGCSDIKNIETIL